MSREHGSDGRAPDILVLGGSISGLATALFVARRGGRVTVLDPDPDVAPHPFDETVGRSPRWTTPQAHHSHAFLARGRGVLHDEAPDVLAALLAAGVHELSLADAAPLPLPDRTADDDALIVLLSRRTTFEALLRSTVVEEPGIDYRVGVGATDLIYDRTVTPPRVVGAVLDDDRHLHADVVVDATGRRGDVRRWLADAGIAMDASDDDCGIAYHSRFYRLRLGADWAPLNRVYTAGSSFDRYSCLVFPGDGDTFSVTFGTLPKDRDLHPLRRDEPFHAAARSLPLIGPWVDARRAEPISGVQTMARMRNQLRRTMVDGTPTVMGLAAVGDAAAISNPAHSRGCSLALLHAQQLADAIVTDGDDPDALAVAVDRILDEVLAPWIEDSRRQDAARLVRWDPDGGHEPPMPDPGRVTNGEAYVASHHDAYVWGRFTRLQQLLVTPDEALTDPELVRRVRAVQAAGLGLPPLDAPSHDELAAILHGVDAAVPVAS